MDFFQHLNIRTKLFSGILVILVLFFVMIILQFVNLGKIEDKLKIATKSEHSISAINELSEINKQQMVLLLEIIQTSEIEEQKQLYKEHTFSTKKVNPLYDSLFQNVKVIFPNNSDAGRVKLVSLLNDSRRVLNDVLVPYFDNVNSIKKAQLEVGDDFLHGDLLKIPSPDDTTKKEEVKAIVKIDAPIIGGSSRFVQLKKLHKLYRENFLQVNTQYTEIKNIFRDVFFESKSDSLSHADLIKWYNTFFFLLAFAAIFVILSLITRTISKPLSKLKDLANKLSKGEQPEHSDVEGTDEIGNMAHALNNLIDGLIKTSEFASEIGRGNFASKFEPLSSQDVLGNSLLEMRKSLQAANEEENKRKIEDQERNWTTEGMAMFGEILRRHTENLGLLSKDIIQNLVKYLNANQGGIFILNDTEPKDIHLELMAAYAYNREKFIKKRIQLGEGLIGGAAEEKYTIHMNELPEEYIEIESGLGGANPNSLLIVPLKLEDNVLGVMEIASFNKFKNYEIELVERIGESIASTLSTAKINTRTAELLEQSRVQTQEMKERDEKMRRNIEELKSTLNESNKREEILRKDVNELETMRVNFVEKDKTQRSRIEELTKKTTTYSKELKSLTTQFNRALESNLEPILLIDEKRKIQFFNEAAEKMTDYNRSEILGLGLESIMDKQTKELIEEDIILYFQTGRKTIIDKMHYIDVISRSRDKVPVVLTMLDIIIRGKRGLTLYIKNLSKVRDLETDRDNAKAELMAKEFDYTTKINILESFIHENGLQIPIDLEAQSDLITWTDKYSINLNIIDQQHKKWIDFINILYRAYKSKAKTKEIAEHISKLLDYTDYHFGFEEKYLEDFKCGNIENHKNEHGAFVNNIKKYQKWHNEGDSEAVYRLIIYLNNWVLGHIQGDDIRYVECFKLNGLS